MKISCWHGRTDTLPRLRRTAPDADTVDVVLTVGIDVQLEADDPLHMPEIEITIHDTPAVEFTKADLQALREKADADQANPDRNDQLRAYADLREGLEIIGYRYFELRLPGQAYGETLEYQIKYQVDGIAGYCGDEQGLYRLIVLDPTFEAKHIRATQTTGPESDWWILSLVSDHGYDCLRLDMLNSIDPLDYFALPRVRFDFPDGEAAEIDVARGAAPGYLLPIVNRNTDTILVCVRQKNGRALQRVGVTTNYRTSPRTTPVQLRRTSYWPTRLLLLNYGIQGLNDLFAPPLPYGESPRTYMQVTLRDDQARYSNRPDRPDSGAPDGYTYTLQGHCFFKVKSQWVFNAGVLALIAHDCPKELNRIRQAIADHLLVPSNAGFGAHRPPYYKTETNLRELVAGKLVIQAYLDYDGPGLNVYYPDQRLFKNGPNELDAYRQAGVEYLVLDRSSVCTGPLDYSRQLFVDGGRSGNFLWTLAGTDRHIGVLLIEDLFRTNIDSWDDDLTLRGKADLALRKRFMELVIRRASQSRPLMVYGDDLDKASGNGWFDGIDYGAHKYHLNDMYLAFLKWVSAHHWVEAITTEALDLSHDSAGELDISSATDPSLDPQGAFSTDQYCNKLHFDTWQQAWQVFPADWLGTTLRQLSDDLETALLEWPETCRNQLFELAWLYFLMFTHESFWNKEPENPNDVNRVRGVLEPEDFVLAESLQQRHAWVFLNASCWAAWAVGTTDTATYVDDGPVVKRCGLYWDHDLLANVIMYNAEVLVVIDRNGGCITNIFELVDGQPVSVSGHFKSFQYFDTAHQGRGINPGIVSNGVVFQNTVFTPNHAYVAADVRQTTPIQGTYARPGVGWARVQDWNYPNNFNAYEYTRMSSNKVRFRYGPGTALAPPSLDRDSFADYCLEDRVLRTAGDTGLVWHDGKYPNFEKVFRLDGRTLHVAYHRVPPGHVVSNEFCVDLYNSVMRARFQTMNIANDRRWVSLSSPDRGRVEVQLGADCVFSDAVLLADPGNAAPGRSEYLILHRVLTDNLQVECPDGGSFDYTVAFT